eukprot:6191829-Pleurochrysis_carterae.AAC.1
MATPLGGRAGAKLSYPPSRMPHACKVLLHDGGFLVPWHILKPSLLCNHPSCAAGRNATAVEWRLWSAVEP